MSTLEQKKLTYKHVMDLGFKRTEDKDAVFESQHGYPFFIVDKKFPRKLSVDWDIETHELKLYKDSNLVRKITPDELLFLIKIFKQP